MRSLGRLLALIWRILKLAAAGPGKLVNLLILGVVIALALIGIHVSVGLINWSRDFYNALQKLDVPEVVHQLAVFAALIATSAALHLAGTYLKQTLLIRWRGALTHALLDRWLADKTYWFLDPVHGGDGIDNPDQRVAEDARLFFEILLGDILEFAISLVGLATYVTLLWQLSTFPLAFTVFGIAIEIPRYMVWAAPIYVAISTGITHWLGRPLTGLYAEQQKREADLRYALVHVRRSAEAVALHDGEAAERRMLDDRFAGVVGIWNRVILRELILGTFTRPYFQTVLRIPTFLALPAFLAGKATLGGLTQLASAFQNVVTTLSFFLFRYKKLAEFAATAKRIGRFLDAMAAPAGTPMRLERQTGGESLVLRDLMLETPDGRRLLELPALTLARGEHVWLRGASGLGKSTLIKTLAGLWPAAEGKVTTPAGKVLFLPQQVYLPIGSIAEASVYPRAPRTRTESETLLARVGLDTVDADGESSGLSGGERQRLAIARILDAKPDWVLLDEFTSALDPAAEEALMRMLEEALPDATFVIVAHRRPRGLSRLREVDLDRLAGR